MHITNLSDWLVESFFLMLKENLCPFLFSPFNLGFYFLFLLLLLHLLLAFKFQSGHQIFCFIKMSHHFSSVESFYDNKCILITGFTGFIGKVIIKPDLQED